MLCLIIFFIVLAIIRPPTYEEAVGSREPYENVFEVTEFSKEEVESALKLFVDNHCCYSKRPLKRITINGIIMSSAFHVRHKRWAQ